LDIYISSVRNGASRLYRGLPGGKFQDVSARTGTKLDTACRSCAWDDVDGDGWIDLYVTSPDGPNHLFHNNHDGTFTDLAAHAGVMLENNESLGCPFGDVDNDGRDDLFVTNYKSSVSALYHNLSSPGNIKLPNITSAAGLAQPCSAVGCTFGDLDND